MLHQVETHSLHPAHIFRYQKDAKEPVGIVTEIGIIDDEFHVLFLYRTPYYELHAHIADHTPVWI